MLALDTNLLVRLLINDDPEQAGRVQAWLESNASASQPAYIDHLVLCELAWVLERSYGYARKLVAAAIAELLEQVDLQVEAPGLVRKALYWHQGGKGDFSDCLIAARAQAAGFESVLTLDRKAARSDTHALLL